MKDRPQVGLTQEAQRRPLRATAIALRATTENTENTEEDEKGLALPARSQSTN